MPTFWKARTVEFGPFEIIEDTDVSTNPDYPFNYSTLFNVNRGYKSIGDKYYSDKIVSTRYGNEYIRVTKDRPYVLRDGYGEGHRTVTSHVSLQIGGFDSPSYPSNWPARFDNAENRSVTIARERLRKKDTFKIGVNLAEAKRTVDMLADSVSNQAKALLAFRRYANNLPKRAKLIAMATAGAWLEGYYGWGQLAKTIDELDRALRKQVTRPLHIKSSCTTRISHSESWNSGNFVHDGDWKGLCKVGYIAKISSEFFDDLDTWGLLNPLDIVWELTPYSFVVDWFVPVGNTLSSLTATAGLDFVDGYITRVNEWEMTSVFKNANIFSQYVALDAGEFGRRGKSFGRVPLTAFQPPALYANENPFNTNRVINALALVTQVVLGR